MLFEEMMDDARAEGFAEGKATGTATGLLRGKTEERKRFQMLIERLSEDDRMEDIMKVADDPDYLEHLFQEYEL